MFLLSNIAKHLHISCHKFMKGPFVILNWKENFVLLNTIYNVLCFHAGRDCKGSLHQKAKSNCKPLSPSCTYWHHTLVYILVYVFSQMASIIFLSGKTGKIAFVYLFIYYYFFSIYKQRSPDLLEDNIVERKFWTSSCDKCSSKLPEHMRLDNLKSIT